MSPASACRPVRPNPLERLFMRDPAAAHPPRTVRFGPVRCGSFDKRLTHADAAVPINPASGSPAVAAQGPALRNLTALQRLGRLVFGGLALAFYGRSRLIIALSDGLADLRPWDAEGGNRQGRQTGCSRDQCNVAPEIRP
jgi:hypothetical protein